MIQVLHGPPRDDAPRDVLFTTKDELEIQKHCLGHVGLLLRKPKLICSLDLQGTRRVAKRDSTATLPVLKRAGDLVIVDTDKAEVPPLPQSSPVRLTVFTRTSPQDQTSCLQGCSETWSTSFQDCSLSSLERHKDQRRTLIAAENSAEGHQNGWGLKHLSREERLREWDLFSLEKRWV